MELTEKQELILKSLRLKNHFETNRSSSNYLNVDQSSYSTDFKTYMPASYRADENLRDMDEVHGFSRRVFLHKHSGIRCQYEIYERYGIGDVYTLSEIFVITITQDYLDLIDADFKSETVTTPKGILSFKELKMVKEEID